MWSVLNGVQKLLARITASRASKIDNLDASVGSRASQTSVNTVDSNVDTLITRLTSGRASNLDLIDDIWDQFPVAAIDWSNKGFQTSAPTGVHADTTHLNITGSGYLVSLTSDDMTWSIQIDGGSIITIRGTSSYGIQLALFPIRFNSSLIIKGAFGGSDTRYAMVVLD